MDELSLPIVGIDFANDDKSKSNRRFELMQCNRGDRLDLVPEPKNKFDEHAIAVFSPNGIQVGYLPSERAPYVGTRMRREPHAAIFQGMTEAVGFVRIRFGGGAPTLPAEAAAARPSSVEEDVDQDGGLRLTRQRRDGVFDDQFDDDRDRRIEGFDWGA
jgi:hypothetical protein